MWMMKSHPHYSSSFEETDTKSVDDERLKETDQLQ